MPPRDGSTRGDRARTGSGRDRASARRQPRDTGRPRASAASAASAARPARVPGPGGGAAPRPVDDVVVGGTPPLARAAGVLLVLAGVAGLAAVFPTYLVVGGQAVSLGGGIGSVLVAWLVPLTSLAIGAALVRGAVPRLGLAYAGVAGALALGQLLIEVYRGSRSTARPALEVLAGERVLTSSVQPGPGWALGLVALGLTVLAGMVAVAAWDRTLMEDAGTLDPARPGLAGAAALLGVGTVLCLVLPAADVPDRLVTDPATGLQTVVEQEGPQGLFERPGLALLGGLLLAGAVVLCSVLAPSLRPRLAAVGGLLAIAVVVLGTGLTGLRDAAVSPDLDWTVPGVGLLITGLGYVVLTVLAARLRRRPEH